MGPGQSLGTRIPKSSDGTQIHGTVELGQKHFEVPGVEALGLESL